MANSDSMARIMVFDRLDTYLFDIDPSQVRGIPYVDEINGEHSMTITTSQELEKTDRLLIRDSMGIYHEYVVLGIVEKHEGHSGVESEYYCIWSLQHDLMGTFINGPYDCGIVPGHASIPQPPNTALGVALSGTTRWSVGTVTVTSMAAASFYRRSGWEGLKTVVEKWGGEIQATITVDSHGVVSRYVDLLAHVGSETATRRFDFGYDVSSIKRTISDDVWPCRIVPLGKAQETENGGYTRRPSIESVNGGVMWLQNDEVVPYTKVPGGNGGWEYPTVIVENDTYEEPSDLKAWALEHIGDYTQPRVSYEAGVVQFVKAGLNPHGVALGDDVVVVDKTFGDEGLRVTARVTKIEGNLLDPSDMKLTIGNIADTLGRQLDGIARQMSQIADMLSRSQQYQTTVEYVLNLVSRINQEINATGGYWYAVPGIGSVTYDTEVSDPAVGSEATQATEMRGGTLRFANTKTASGDWNWTNVITADGYLALAATIARITAGSIGSPSGNYWNLDTGEFRMASTAKVGDQTLAQYIGDNLGLTQEEVFNLLTNNGAVQGLYMSNGQLYMNASYINSGAINASLITTGTLSANLITSGSMSADRITSGTMSASRINGGTLKLGGDNNASGLARVYNSSNNLIVELGYYGISLYHSDSYKTLIRPATYNSDNYLLVTNTSPNSKYARMHVGGSFGGQITVGDYTRGSDYYSEINTSTSTLLGSVKIGDCLKVGSTQWSQSTAVGTVYCCQLKASQSGYGLVQAERLSVSGSKSRVVETEDYSDRLLYCYETPEPYFGDVGSATIGDDGTCVVSIDDIFQETARTDMAYQVFLQKCGPGDLWVSQKTPTHFVVEGTAGLPFDWEVKAHQVGYETERLEDARIDDEASSMGIAEPPSFKTYEDDLRYVQQIESLYEEAA